MKYATAIKVYLVYSLLLIAIVVVLGIVRVDNLGLPAGEMAAQWDWLGKTGLWFTGSIFLLLFIYPKERNLCVDFYQAIVWVLILYGAFEALLGLRQLYGFSHSNHAGYNLTGSFFNPGPYSGYLAMVVPLCLSEWLRLKAKSRRTRIEAVQFYTAGSVLVLIVCVLPAGMSRSAWGAALLSGVWVWGMHQSWISKCRQLWARHPKKMVSCCVVVLFAVLIGAMGAFYLKRDSASGRLFMWKISCQAIALKPIAGYGQGAFAEAYGSAQEAYFAKGDYSEREERVAGSPEYAFNEYLQVGVEYGVPLLVCLLAFIGLCLWRGVVEKRVSACGGIISLLVFSFSSYPMQIPVFIVTFAFLLSACVVGKSRVVLGVFALVVGLVAIDQKMQSKYEACKKWTRARMVYQSGAYQQAKDTYVKLYPQLNTRAAFLYEYGHCLHKLEAYEESSDVLKEAIARSCDPMILNIIAKNEQMLGRYESAEYWLKRSVNRLPGRIYPYYLLAKLYAEPAFNHPEKMKQAAQTVLTKEPKVQSTAVKEMREEMKILLN